MRRADGPLPAGVGPEPVRWDLGDLAGAEGTGLGAHERRLLDRSVEIQAALRGRVSALSPDGLAAAMTTLEALLGDGMRVLLAAELLAAADTSDRTLADRQQGAREVAWRIQAGLAFVAVELRDLPEAQRAQLREAPALSSRRQLLEALWRQDGHRLSGPEERILLEKAPTGAAAWRQLFTTLVSRLTVPVGGEELSLEQALGLLEQGDAERREAAVAAISSALERDIDTRAHILDTVVHDAVIEDRLRGRRGWLGSATAALGISEETAGNALDAVERHADSCRRHHRLKARLMGLEQLRYDRDRLAPIGPGRAVLSWDEARDIVVDGFSSLSPTAGAIAERAFADRWIDARASPTKAPHAFTVMVPERHPHVLLSYRGTLRSLLTLAHEIGQAVHSALAADQPLLVSAPPPLLAEAMSLLGEHAVLRRLMAAEADPGRRLEVLMTLLDSAMNMVFRHAALTRFEGSLHAARREGRQLTAERISDLWMTAHHDLVTPGADLPQRFRSWWSHLPHLVSVPGGELHHTLAFLIAQALAERPDAEGDAAAGPLVSMMRAGGSRPVEELAAMVGVRLDDPALWDEQLDVLAATVAQAEDLASACPATR